MKTLTFEQMEQVNGGGPGCGSAMVGYTLSFIGVCSGVGTLLSLASMALSMDQMIRNCDVNESLEW